MTAAVTVLDPPVAPADAADLIEALPSIGLPELTSRGALLTRVDRKYVVPLVGGPAPLCIALQAIAANVTDLTVLDIGGHRRFRYRSTYFDTPEMVSYLAATRRRRRRFKVRIRSYEDTGGSFLEVKTRGCRGTTVKQRIPYEGAARAGLRIADLDFVRSVLSGARIHADLLALRPTLTTGYHRTTLFSPALAARLTVDTSLAWSLPAGPALALRGHAIVEIKSGPSVTAIDRVLHAMGHRPRSVSKYCTGPAAVRPDLPAHRWLPVLERYFAAEGAKRS